jgi:hypothetical protein
MKTVGMLLFLGLGAVTLLQYHAFQVHIFNKTDVGMISPHNKYLRGIDSLDRSAEATSHYDGPDDESDDEAGYDDDEDDDDEDDDE